MTNDIFEELRRRERLMDSLYGGRAARRAHEEMQRGTISALAKSGVLDTARLLSQDGGFLSTVRGFRDNLGPITASAERLSKAFADGRLLDTFKQLETTLSPLRNPVTLASIDAQARALSIANYPSTVSALRHAQDSQILDAARRISEAFNGQFTTRMAARADIDDESDVEIEGDFAGLEEKAKTGALDVADLLRIIEIAFLFYSLAQAILGYGYTPEDRQRDDIVAEQVKDTHEDIEALRHQMDCLVSDCASAIQTEIFANLPKAFVKSSANLRIAPSGSAKRLARLPVDETIGILSKQGRWYEVKFFDPADGRLRDGWIWARSVELM